MYLTKKISSIMINMMLKLRFFLKASKGFTFVEVMVVVAIIGILTTIIVSSYLSAKQRSRDGQRKSDLSLVQAAIEQYKADYNAYPCFNASANECSTDVSPSSTAVGGWSVVSSLSSINFPGNYIRNLPKDPVYNGASCTTTNPFYLYWHGIGRQRYMLFANLENTNDSEANLLKPVPADAPGICVVGSSPCSQFKITSGACNGVIFNYWITNP